MKTRPSIDIRKEDIIGNDRRRANVINTFVDVEITYDVSYIDKEDVTIVWQYMFVGDRLMQQTIIGWYYGEPRLDELKQLNDRPNGIHYTNTAYYLD